MYATVAPHFTRELLSPGLRVGYTDEGGVWPFVAPSLLQRLPLRAIEWRNLVGVTKRIDQLPLHFVDLSGAEQDRRDVPLACIYTVKCEDGDSYKRTVRPSLLAWIDVMTAAKVEWLILYVPLGTRPKATNKDPNLVYKKIFDRLRADFGHPKSSSLLRGPRIIGPAKSTTLVPPERVCKIDALDGTSVVGQQQQHERQWTALLLRLRQCVMDAFQTRCFEYEERLRVLGAQRGTSGWDVGAFFVAKDRLALMYQQMDLQDDAMRHLDELDATFVNLSEREKHPLRASSHHAFTSQDAIFTQSPLAIQLSETQQWIATNQASLQRVSLYCFCRQVRLLYVMGNFPHLLARATVFIESFLMELRAMALEWYYPYLWAVGACLEVAYACELSWSGRDDEWTASSVSVQAAQAIPVDTMARSLGNVLYLARRLLKTLKRASSHQPRCHAEDPRHQVVPVSWYQRLGTAVVRTDCASYERCLSEVSHLASMHFSLAGRHRFAVFLGAECATYHLACGEYESALRLVRSVARQSREDGWWTIFGACVRTICRAELARGRLPHAVAACFGLLQVAHETPSGLTQQEIQDLIEALVTNVAHGASEVALGELVRPTLDVETTQGCTSLLEHGDLRVTLSLATALTASVCLETVCVRFTKVHARKEPVASAAHVSDERPQRRQCQGGDTPGGTHGHGLVPMVHYGVELLLEASNVQLEAQSGAKLVFRRSHVPVGQYACTAVECVVAGQTFPLLSTRHLQQASFDIGADASTAQVAISGPPVLVPRPLVPVETIRVSIHAHDETIGNGTLDLRVVPRTRNMNIKVSRDATLEQDDELDMERDGQDKCTLHFIQAIVHPSFDSALGPSGTDACVDSHGTCGLTVALPQVLPGDYVTYVVSLAVSPLNCPLNVQAERDEDEDEDEGNVTMQASVQYRRNASATATWTRVQGTEATFCIVPPVTNVMRFQRVDSRVFLSVALTCNAVVPVTLRDYRLQYGHNVWPATTVRGDFLTVPHEPMVPLRGTCLRPQECVQLTWTLLCGPKFDAMVQNTDCTLVLELAYGKEALWVKTMALHVPLAQVRGKWYRIHVRPRDTGSGPARGEAQTFEIIVYEGGAWTSLDRARIVSLCLDDRSEQDWILVGKQQERLTLSPSPTDQTRAFRTHKRLVATRVGRLRYPAFRLHVNGDAIPSSRVYCQQSSRRLQVTWD